MLGPRASEEEIESMAAVGKSEGLWSAQELESGLRIYGVEVWCGGHSREEFGVEDMEGRRGGREDWS